MARLVFGMNQSLDGYVDHMAFAPSPTLFRHFVEEARQQAGSLYGRRIYEIMRYWDDDHRSGARTSGPSRRHGGSSRSGWCRAPSSRWGPTPPSSGRISRDASAR
jgi:hypothetical protein